MMASAGLTAVNDGFPYVKKRTIKCKCVKPGLQLTKSKSYCAKKDSSDHQHLEWLTELVDLLSLSIEQSRSIRIPCIPMSTELRGGAAQS